jgi:hypothetical protein
VAAIAYRYADHLARRVNWLMTSAWLVAIVGQVSLWAPSSNVEGAMIVGLLVLTDVVIRLPGLRYVSRLRYATLDTLVDATPPAEVPRPVTGPGPTHTVLETAGLRTFGLLVPWSQISSVRPRRRPHRAPIDIYFTVRSPADLVSATGSLPNTVARSVLRRMLSRRGAVVVWFGYVIGDPIVVMATARHLAAQAAEQSADGPHRP